MRISDWSSDVCSSDLHRLLEPILPEPRLIGFPHRPAAPAERVRRELFAAVGNTVTVGIVAAAIERPRIVGDASADEARAGWLRAAADRDVRRAGGMVARLVRRVEMDMDRDRKSTRLNSSP